MTLTKKEQNLLKDLQQEEKLCAEKYRKAAESACDPCLAAICEEIHTVEEEHYQAVTDLLNGCIPEMKQTKPCSPCSAKDLKSQANRKDKQQDAYLASDLLATEKYISANYNTTVFECCDENMRQVLSKIQQQEQHHGKQLSDYMQANNLYC